MALSPSSEFGVRHFINLLLALLAYYLRHKEAIDAAIEGDNKTLMEGLVGQISNFRNVNEPGPE